MCIMLIDQSSADQYNTSSGKEHHRVNVHLNQSIRLCVRVFKMTVNLILPLQAKSSVRAFHLELYMGEGGGKVKLSL
jgi:hypothetical protein